MDLGLGDLLSAGVSLFEGKKTRKLAKDQFRTQLDESVQRRVADAKKAGVHPLFALGASVGASPTTQYGGGDISAAGDALGAAVDKAMSYKSRKGAQAKNEQVLDSQIRRNEAAAQADQAQAGYYDAQAARIRQQGASQGRDQNVSDIEGQGLVTFPLAPRDPTGVAIPVPKVTAKGARQVAGERQMAAHPTRNVYKLPFGFELHTEAGFSPGEALEQHYGDIGSAPWQVAMLIEDSLKGRVRNPTLERWLKKHGSAGRRWMERELWKIETRMQRRKK